MRKLKSIALFTVIAIFVSSFTACSGDDPEPDSNEKTTIAKQTILMFLPYSGNLYSDFLINISDFEKSIVNNGGLNGNKFLIYIAKNQTTSYLIDVQYEDGKCTQDTLGTYTFDERNYTTADGIAAQLNEVKTYAPAYKYAMCIEGHGSGWLPVDYTASIVGVKERTISRVFGTSDKYPKYQINTTTLADGIKKANMKMQFILFDCCYMSNVETAYDLKDAADYLIASTCEVIDYGMPYEDIGAKLLDNDYETVCDLYYNFYSDYYMPCGQIAVTDLSKIDDMATVMKDVNTAYPNGVSNIYSLQKLDGYYPTIFFDFEDYVNQLCDDETLKTTFSNALNGLVIYKRTTDLYFTELSSPNKRTINTFSGLTISEPSKDTYTKSKITSTGWYKASH